MYEYSCSTSYIKFLRWRMGACLFIFLVVPHVLFNFRLLFIFIVVPGVLFNFQDGGWAVVIYIYSLAMCYMQCPRWQLGGCYLYL